MKKLLGIVVLGLLLSGCSTTETHLHRGNITIGQSKSSFCYAVNSMNFKSDSCMNDSSRYYNLETKKEILSDSYKEIFFVFKNVNRRTKGHGGPKRHGDGVLEKIFYNYEEAVDFASKKETVKKTITKTTQKEPKDNKEEISGASGTAFFIDNNGHMITNHHVIDGCKDRSQISYNNENIKAKLIAKDDFLDLALLKADVKNSNFINISSAPPKKLKRIIVAGYPFGLELSNDLKFNSGIITSLKGLGDDSTRIQIDAAINPGNSGGPIVYEDSGELAAVAVAGLSKDKTEAVNFGIKASSVKNFLQSNQIDLTLAKQKFNFGNDDLAELLESSTLYTFCK